MLDQRNALFSNDDPSDIDAIVEPAHPNLLRMERILKRNRVGQWLPLVVFAVSVFLTHQLWRDAERTAERTSRAEFDFQVQEELQTIRQRMLAYEQVLRGASGLFAATGLPDRKQFRAYVESLHLDKIYPGIQGIGYAALLPTAGLDRHVQEMRRQGFSDYAVTPPGRRPVVTSILYLEPFYGRNLRAFGYDMFSEPVRRAAMERARDTGEAALSGKVTLVQETGHDPQLGFLMYLPVYRSGSKPETVAQRQASLIGWVYAPFRVRDLIIQSNESGENRMELDMELYDGGAVAPETRMLDLHPGTSHSQSNPFLSRTDVLRIAGHDWTVVSTAIPDRDGRAPISKPELIIAFGLGASLLLALLAWLFVDDRIYAMRAARQAMQLALYDSLTGLPNRKLMAELAARAIERARRDDAHLALLFVDLDEFKPVNDTHGHAVGDILLKEAADRLRQSVRRSDTVARLGGDEFVVLLPHLRDRNSAAVIAEKIRARLVEPFSVAGHTLRISASIGIAHYREDGDNADALLKQADMAMYQAKDGGRNRVVQRTL